MQSNDKGKENSYRSILKGTSLLGGVQLFQALLALVRGKFVAILLGPGGMGVNSLFVSSANTITQVANMGLSLAIVKETAAASGEPRRLAAIARVAMTMVRLSALAGMLLCILLAPRLSILTFGDDGYARPFMLLGAVIYLMVVSNGLLALLQGLHEVKILARNSVIGGLAGLAAGVPLYWLWGTDGIVPALLAGAAAMILYQHLALRRVMPRIRVRLTRGEHLPMARRLAAMGLILVSSSVISTLCQYAVNVLVRAWGSLGDVGLYNAANSLTAQYSGMVFAALSMDYFPRLAAAAESTRRMNAIVNRQSEVVGFVIAPLAIAVVLFAPLAIRILLTGEFLEVTPLVRWMAFGVVLKAMAFPLGYIAFAKNNKRLFFWLEGIAGNLLYLLMSAGGFRLFGLMGLGYAMAAENALLIVIYYAVNRRAYGYGMSRGALGALGLAAGLAGVSLAGSYLPGAAGYVTPGIALIIAGIISGRRLRAMLRK